MKEEKAAEKDFIDPLARTGKLFGALINDVKRRYSVYLSDLKDGLNGQCAAATIFLFFAVLSPAITFGGLLEEKTDKWMGASETLLGSAVVGIISSLFLGQPLLVIGLGWHDCWYSTGDDYKAPQVALYKVSQVALYKAHYSLIWVR